jgi:hypothetical protein
MKHSHKMTMPHPRYGSISQRRIDVVAHLQQESDSIEHRCYSQRTYPIWPEPLPVFPGGHAVVMERVANLFLQGCLNELNRRFCKHRSAAEITNSEVIRS